MDFPQMNVHLKDSTKDYINQKIELSIQFLIRCGFYLLDVTNHSLHEAYKDWHYSSYQRIQYH